MGVEKATEKSRYRLFAKITDLLTDMNETLSYTGLKIETNTDVYKRQVQWLPATPPG